MGRVLSQSEIDNMLRNSLKDASVLPEDSDSSDDSAPMMSDTPTPAAFADFPHLNLKAIQPAVPAAAESDVPPAIAAFKAKMEAAKAAREAEKASQK